MVKWGRFVFFAFALVLLASAGLRDLWEPDEPRYAEVAREMLQSGDWVIPHLNGQVYADKPPFFFWAVAASAKFLFQGNVNAFAARLPSLLAALLSLLLVWRLGARLFGGASGFFAMGVAATTYRFWTQAAWAQMEMLLSFFILAALFCFWRLYSSVEKPSRLTAFLYWAPFYLSLSLGFLTKGPIGILIPCGIIFFFLLWERRLSFLLKMWIPLGVLILLAVAGGWAWAAYAAGGKAYLYEHFIRQNVTRYTDPWAHARPFYYYFINLPIDSLPWIFFLPFAVRQAWREAPGPKRSPRRFLLAWFALIFVFFSLSSSKRNLYLTSLFPAVALFLGGYFASAGGSPRTQKAFGWTVVGIFSLMAAVLLAVFPYANRFKSARPFCAQVREKLGTDGKLGNFGLAPDTTLYFLGGKPWIRILKTPEDLNNFFNEPGKAYVLMQAKDLQEWKQKIPLAVLADQKVGHRHVYLVRRAAE